MYLDNFADFINETDAVIGVTCSDIKDTPSIDDYQEFLQSVVVFPTLLLMLAIRMMCFLLNALLTCLNFHELCASWFQ